MPKSIGVILILVVIVIGVFALFWSKNSGPPSELVEIKTNPGAKIFAKLPGGEEKFLNSVSKSDVDELSQIKVDVPINADVVLRYDNNEEIIAYEEWHENKLISVNFNQPIAIMINARPEAYVFIMLPDGEGFIEPRIEDFIVPPEPIEQNTNLTPIRGGGLKVLIGTTIKLVYQSQEKIFTYEEWKRDEQISYNFSNP